MKRINLKDSQRSIIQARIRAAVTFSEQVDENKGVDASAFQQISKRDRALVAGDYWERQGRPDVRWKNHLAPALLVRHAVITGGETKFLVEPTKAQYEEQAKTAEGLLNYSWQALSFDEECKAADWDKPILKRGVVEIGWIYEDESVTMRGNRPGQTDKSEGSPDDPVPDDATPAMIGGKMVEPQSVEFETPEDAQEALESDVMTRRPGRDDPFVERFDPTDFMIDPMSVKMDLSDARYVFRRKEEYVTRIKGNKEYSAKARGKVVADHTAYPGDVPKGESEGNMKDAINEDFGMVTIYDGYVFLDVDKDGQEELLHVIFAKGVKEELLCEPSPYEFPSSNPFPFEVHYNWKPDNDSQLGASDVSQNRWAQVMDDQSRTQIDIKRTTSKDMLMLPKELKKDEEFQTALETREPNVIAYVNQAYMNQIKWLERPPINMEAYKQLENTPAEIRENLGVSDYQLNAMPERKMLATEVLQMREQGGTRQSRDHEDYCKFRSRVGLKVLMLFQQFQVAPRDYCFTHKDGQTDWGTASYVDLLGEDKPGKVGAVGVQFKVKIDASSEPARSKALEREQKREFWGAIEKYVQAPDPLVPGRNMVNLRNGLQMLAEAYDITDVASIIPSEPSPEDKEALYMQALQMLKGKVDELTGKLANVQAAQQGPPMQASGPIPEMGTVPAPIAGPGGMQ